ncbi:hypothetical protein AKO1_013815 [Acrasis kona]|uniref:HAUS augmin-like complex subunit 4 n=1 Tax=Acrasis kona TaxID=1008807 RepID=A0AAW2YLI9_9EUKA
MRTKEVLDNLQKQPLNNDQDVEQRIQSLNLSKLIHLSETESLLSISDEHEKNLYGLTPENIYQCNAPTDIQNIEQFIQTNIYPEVEEKLQQKYDSLVQFFNPGSHSDIDELNQSQILNITMSGRYTLPNEINKMKKKIQTDKDNVQRECEKTFLNYWAYFRCLAESIDVLITILEDYKLKSFHEFDEVYLLHLRQTSHTMRLKLKVIEYQCINNTYNLNAVQSLKEMRALLEKEYESCLQQSDLVDKELEQYNVVGANFGKLVEEYTQLCQKIKLKKWELEQLEE